MNRSMTLNKKAVTTRTLITLSGIAAAVALPQIFHFIGTVSGTGAELGSALLPMHIPVLLAGFLGGPLAGILSGILSPLISFGISGMPAAAKLPFMIIELGAYGLTAGLLSKVKLNSFVKLLIVQIAGRAARALAVLSAIYVLGNTQLTVASIASLFTTGLFGVILQWALIPLLTEHLEGLKKYE